MHGSGAPLFLGFPLMPSEGDLLGARAAESLVGFVAQFTDRYRVPIADYPSIERSGDIPPGKRTAQRVAGDLLAIADAAIRPVRAVGLLAGSSGGAASGRAERSAIARVIAEHYYSYVSVDPEASFLERL